MIRYAAAILALTMVYALALASLNFWDLLFGFVLASVLVFIARRRGFAQRFGPVDELSDSERLSPGEATRRFFAFFPFALAVAGETVSGSWRVLLAVIGLKPPREPGVVAVPLGERTQGGVAVSAFVATLAPGTILIRVDEDERVMWLHAIDAEDPEAVRRGQQEFYEHYQRRVFP